jgi:HlyD family secretion protein
MTSNHRSPRQGKAPWRRLVPWLFVAVVITLIVLGLRPRPTEVEIATVTTGALSVSVLEEGKTRIRHRYVISNPMAGFLNRVALRAGDPLERDKTVLATIQATPASLLDPRLRAEAEARVHMAEASQQRAGAELERARAALDLAKKQWERTDRLVKRDAVSAWDADAAKNLVTVSERALRAAEFAEQVSGFELMQTRAALISGQQSTGSSSDLITLVSPVTGVVLNVLEESARTVAPGTPIFEIGDPTDLETEIELLSSDAVAVRPGDDVSIEQWGGPQPLRGKVVLVEPGGFMKISALGVEEQRVRVRVDFVDPLPTENPLGDRYRVEGRITTWSAPSVVQIPTGALFRRGGEWMTFLFENSKARLAKVQIGHNSGIAAEVLSGVTPGQQVILHPPDTITEGARVELRAAPH